jgi:hypothetical protein
VLLALSLLLAACANPFAAQPTAAPTPEPPTAEPSPTPVDLSVAVRMDAAGFSINHPPGWQTRELSRTLTLAPSDAAIDAPNPTDELVVVVESTPLAALAQSYGVEQVADVEELFTITSELLEQAGSAYSLGGAAARI